MNGEIKQALIERGADIVRFVDISELPLEQTRGYNKAIIFCLALSKSFISDVYNNVPFEHDEYLEKDEKVNEFGTMSRKSTS